MKQVLTVVAVMLLLAMPCRAAGAVSYTHLDVYKRQLYDDPSKINAHAGCSIAFS